MTVGSDLLCKYIAAPNALLNKQIHFSIQFLVSSFEHSVLSLQKYLYLSLLISTSLAHHSDIVTVMSKGSWKTLGIDDRGKFIFKNLGIFLFFYILQPWQHMATQALLLPNLHEKSQLLALVSLNGFDRTTSNIGWQNPCFWQ